ncbi:hypothetical protein [Paenibacillus sp. N3.4]|uniref:hypothetical protein n=1 Tax=Paenibacillus sp. N3.4 TaxID=2603222 RepID=UPI001C9C4FCF
MARSLFYDRLLEDYAEHPRTIILSTHLIDEVSRLLEHVLVIDSGKLLLNEDADALRGRACAVSGLATVGRYIHTGERGAGTYGFRSRGDRHDTWIFK